LSSPFINAQGTTEKILQQNSANPALLKAIQGLKHIVPDKPHKKQLDDICMKTMAITTTNALHKQKRQQYSPTPPNVYLFAHYGFII
jgi:uncharacterized protein YktA (UPF0223 family)